MTRRMLLLALVLALLPAVARAEGPLSGGTRLYVEEEPIGPFTLSSFAAPNPPVTTDRLWVTVQLRDGARAVQDARVWVTLTDPEGGRSPRTAATHDLAATRLDYTAALPVSQPGLYEVRIEMEHPDGDGTVEYRVNVNEPLTRFIFIVMAAPALLVALLLVHRFVVRLPGPAAVLVGDDRPLEKEM